MKKTITKTGLMCDAAKGFGVGEGDMRSSAHIWLWPWLANRLFPPPDEVGSAHQKNGTPGAAIAMIYNF